MVTLRFTAYSPDNDLATEKDIHTPLTRKEILQNGGTLEPLTREEIILAGGTLEPLTREEYFLIQQIEHGKTEPPTVYDGTVTYSNSAS